MDNYILLMKNGEIIIASNIDHYFENIEYILFQADNQLNTFLLHEPKRYMLDMDKAEIIYESVITQQCTEDDLYDMYTSPMSHTEKTVNSLVELMQYLQSLHRIWFFNDVARSNDCPRYEEIQFCYFKITLFCHGKKIFKKVLSYKKENKVFYPSYILEDIKGIYDPVKKFPDRFLSIDYHDMQWGFFPELHYDDMCGILLKSTRTITFFKFIDLLPLKYRLKSVMTQILLFSPETISEATADQILEDAFEDDGYREVHQDFYPARLMDKWDLKIPDILETITYLPYIFMTFKTTSELYDMGKLKNTYIVKAVVIIETENSETIQYMIKEDDPFLPMDLIKIFNEGDDEDE